MDPTIISYLPTTEMLATVFFVTSADKSGLVCCCLQCKTKNSAQTTLHRTENKHSVSRDFVEWSIKKVSILRQETTGELF